MGGRVRHLASAVAIVTVAAIAGDHTALPGNGSAVNLTVLTRKDPSGRGRFGNREAGGDANQRRMSSRGER